VSQQKGTVYLVGAGPGDPRLITVRGRQCLERSDVIVYDRLVSPQLLRYAKREAEKIYVGKSPEGNTLEQEDINFLLRDLALQGKTVTRLKGGDPSVFARVGEEAEELARHGVPFELVPGISSALGAPLYAGIPVTHRDLATSFHVVTGHEDPNKPDGGVNWADLARVSGTLVILMGVGRIGGIAGQLIAHGRDSQTPVALVRWGTRAEQETLTGTLQDIAAKVAESSFKNPAVIVVGEVVRLRETLQWVEQRPLFGQRIVVTRARSQASELSRLVEDLGGEPYEFPVIRTVAPDDFAPLDDALQRGTEWDWILFTSVNGVEMFWERMRHNRVDVRSFATAKIAAVGAKTASALAERNLQVEVTAPEYVAESLLEALGDLVHAGEKILLPRANIARKFLPDALRERGCAVVEVDAYKTEPVTENAAELAARLADGEIHAITFTSASTVNNFVAAMAGHDLHTLLQGVTTAMIGPVTAQAAEERDLPVSVIADTYTIQGLTEALISHSRKTL
jgi:uroporphyrinogen III methyltransferase / synthase